MDGNGFYFPKMPEMDIRDIHRMQNEVKVGEINELETEESMNDLKDYFNSCKQGYSGKTMLLYQQSFKIEE